MQFEEQHTGLWSNLPSDSVRHQGPTPVDNSDGPYAWHHWQKHVKLDPGTHEVWVRATDAWGRSQPMDVLSTWKPGGWDWHGVRVAFKAA